MEWPLSKQMTAMMMMIAGMTTTGIIPTGVTIAGIMTGRKIAGGW
jgi:hypothetical protein